MEYLTKIFDKQEQLPVTESESNRMCLAYWPIFRVRPNDYEEDDDILNYITPLTDYFVETNDNSNDQIDVSFIVLTKSTNSETFSITCSVCLLIIHFYSTKFNLIFLNIKLWETFKNSKKLKITDDSSFRLCEKNINNQIYNNNVPSQRNIDNKINKNDHGISSASASALILNKNNLKEIDNSFLFDYKGKIFIQS